MGLTLPGKDLLVVGFWTDWGYLNDVIANALNVNPFGSVTVVDPKSSADLQATAPALWGRLTSGTAHFQHVPASGADALEELQECFSKVWAKKFFALGKTMFEADGKHYSAIDPALSCEELYSFRQDAEGVPYHRAAKLKAPSAGAASAAFCHLLLIEAKATRQGSWYKHGGKLVRVVQGAGEAITTVRERYKEPPAALQPDVVVCAGALDIPIPAHLIASGAGASVVRPSAGGRYSVVNVRPSSRRLSDMTDLKSPVQVVLQDAGYETWLMSVDGLPAVGFEDSAVMGFVCIFEDASSLLRRWRDLETKLLTGHASSLQKAGEKTWNIYCVFLSSGTTDEVHLREIRWIEEDLERTRKIAACGLSTRDEIVKALLPLLPIQRQPFLDTEDFDLTQRLRKRIASIAPDAAGAVLDESVTPAEVVRLLGA
jgi:hypothetical protein